MSISSTASVDENNDLSGFLDSQPLGNPFIENPVRSLDLNKMIATSKTSKLRGSARSCTARHLRRVGCLHAALFLDCLRIFWPRISFVDSPIEAISNRLVELDRAKFDLSPASEA